MVARVIMKYLIMVTLLFPLVICGAANAESARFEPSTGVLNLDCVRIPAANNASYAIDLRYSGTIFELSTINETPITATCPNTFDLAANTLNAQVRIFDESYQLALILNAGDTFSIHSIEHLGLGPTSLWRVSNGPNEVIVGGTIHLLKSSDFPVHPAYTQAYLQSDILVTEIDKTELDNFNSITPYLALPQGRQSLFEALSASTYQSLANYLAPHGLSVQLYENIHPNWVANDIQNLAYSELGYQEGVDYYFMDLANAQGKVNWGLETLLDQVLVINQLNGHLTTEQLILQYLSQVESPQITDSIRATITAWREGSLEKIEELIVEPLKTENLSDYNTLLVDRNTDWIAQIQAFLETREVEYILVGVAHLAGDDSVLSKLEQLGYQISGF